MGRPDQALGGWSRNAQAILTAKLKALGDEPSIGNRIDPLDAGHSIQVTIVDRQERSIWRTNELPSSRKIATNLVKL